MQSIDPKSEEMGHKSIKNLVWDWSIWAFHWMFAGSMIHGRQRVVAGNGIKSSQPIPGRLIVATAAAFVFQLPGNYKKRAGQVQLHWLLVTLILDETGAEHRAEYPAGAPWKSSNEHKEDDDKYEQD